MKYFRFQRPKPGHYAMVRAANWQDAHDLIHKHCYPFLFSFEKEFALNDVPRTVLSAMSSAGTDFAFYSDSSFFATTNK